MQTIGTVYSKKGQEGDFDWQIRSGNSATTPNRLLGTSIFQIGDDVREYITQQIKQL